MKPNFARLVMGSLLLLQLQTIQASEFEKQGSSLAKALGTKKVFQKSVTVDGKKETVYYAKGEDGKATKMAVVQKGLYKPDCTHTWVIGMTADAKVDQIRVVEMKCPHAFPTNKAFFLDQYKGKGSADIAKLKDGITTVAKATATSNLTTDAVVSSIKDAVEFNKVAN